MFQLRRSIIAAFCMIALVASSCYHPSSAPPKDEQGGQPCVQNAVYDADGFHSSCQALLKVGGKSYGMSSFNYKMTSTRGGCDTYSGHASMSMGGDVDVSMDEGMAKVGLSGSRMGSMSVRPVNMDSLDQLYLETRLPDGSVAGKTVYCNGLDQIAAQLLKEYKTDQACNGQPKVDSMMRTISAKCPNLENAARDLMGSTMMSSDNAPQRAVASVMATELPQIAMRQGGSSRGVVAGIIALVVAVVVIAIVSTYCTPEPPSPQSPPQCDVVYDPSCQPTGFAWSC